MSSRAVYRMCAQVATSGEYLRGHGRVAVDVTALRRLWSICPCYRPCCSGLRASLCCPAWQLLLWLRFVNLNKDTIIITTKYLGRSVIAVFCPISLNVFDICASLCTGGHSSYKSLILLHSEVINPICC